MRQNYNNQEREFAEVVVQINRISKKTKDDIEEFYETDFNTFGYEPKRSLLR